MTLLIKASIILKVVFILTFNIAALYLQGNKGRHTNGAGVLVEGQQQPKKTIFTRAAVKNAIATGIL